MDKDFKKRIENPYFWLGLAGVVFAAAGVDFKTLTDWGLLWEAFLNILKNPVAVVSVTTAIIGVFVDPTTKGLTDCPNKSNNQ